MSKRFVVAGALAGVVAMSWLGMTRPADAG